MPSFTFVLPHWTYWGTLILLPLVAMYLVRRQRRDWPVKLAIPIGAALIVLQGLSKLIKDILIVTHKKA